MATKNETAKVVTLPKAADITAFVKHVRATDLLLRGRTMDEAPEGAGSWAYLIAAWLGCDRRAVTGAMVTTVKTADAKAREAAKAAKAKARTTKAATAKAAAAPVDEMEALRAELAEAKAALDILAEKAIAKG